MPASRPVRDPGSARLRVGRRTEHLLIALAEKDSAKTYHIAQGAGAPTYVGVDGGVRQDEGRPASWRRRVWASLPGEPPTIQFNCGRKAV